MMKLNKKVNPTRLEVMGACTAYSEWYSLQAFGVLGEVLRDDCFWNGQNLVSEESCNCGCCALFYDENRDRYNDIRIDWYENDLITVTVIDEDENELNVFEI